MAESRPFAAISALSAAPGTYCRVARPRLPHRARDRIGVLLRRCGCTISLTATTRSSS